MEDTYLKNLETAAHIIMAPPNSVTNAQRQESEAIFMNFRKTKSPYALCQAILEKSIVDLVLFEAADVLKKAVIGEWKFIPDQDKASLRHYLLNYIMQRDIPVFIREKLLQVVAIMIKRVSLDDVGVERGQIMEDAKKMLNSGDLKQQILSCNVILAILEEYCNIIRSDDTGLTTYEHFRAKKQFEDNDLLRVFVMTLHALEELIKMFNDFNNMHSYLFKQLLTIMETILTWGFLLPNIYNMRRMQPLLSKKIIDTSETVTKVLHTPPLRLHVQWKSVIFQPTLLEIFFYIYWKTRENDELQPKALTCILQLSTLRGNIILDNKEETKTYLTNFLTHFLSLLSNVEIKEKEAYSFSLILRKLFQLAPASEIKTVTESLFNAYMQQCLTMTLKFIELSSLEESNPPEETIYVDALSNLLNIWLSIINNKDDFPSEVMAPFITQMFERYLQYHLAVPDGMRGVGRDTESGENEITELEESDRERFKEQLIIIGYFGREIASHAIPILSKLLEDRTRKLGTQLHMLHSTKGMSISSGSTLENIFDDLHWLLLISGHVLALDQEGEVATIPGPILQLSGHHIANGVTDVASSFKLLASPHLDIQELGNAQSNADPVIRLLATGFRLCELEKSAIEVRMYQFLSPELSSTLIWFLRHWCDAYLMPVNNEPVRNIFNEAFGSDTAGSQWVINYLLNKICLNSQVLRAEQTVVAETVELLLVMQRRKSRAQAIFSSEFFRSMCDLRGFELPPTAKRKLLKSFVMLANSVESQELRGEYLGRILAPVEEKYNLLLGSFAQVDHQNEEVKQKVIEVLEETIGCVQGSYGNLMPIVFTKVQIICKELAVFISVYRNDTVIVELVLELLYELEETTEGMSVRSAVYQCCYDVIRVYVRNNSNRVSLDPTRKESDPQDLILVLKLINNLASRGLFGDDDEESLQQATDVCIFGLTNIIPLITVELIKYPDLCSQYYTTITTFVESKSHMVRSLHPDFLKQLLGSIELGLTSFTSEIESKCLEFIAAYASMVYGLRDPQAPISQLLEPILKLMLDMLFGQKIGFTNTIEWYKSLFSVICCFPQLFKDIIQNFLQEHIDTNNEKAKELINESHTLINHIEYVSTRTTKFQFIERFPRFVLLVNALYKG